MIPQGCCEGHFDRLGVIVPALHGGLCQACIDGKPLRRVESVGIAPVEKRHRGPDRKPRKRKPKFRRRSVAEILRDKAAGVKVCSMCGNPKELFLFRKQASNSDGRSCACSMCLSKNWMQKYYRRSNA